MTDSNKLLMNLGPIEIVALTIFGEARGEPIEGMVAVGCVIRNRLHNSDNSSYLQVCLRPKQFSCWNPDDPNFAQLLDYANKMIAGMTFVDPGIRLCLWIAQGIIDWIIPDNTQGAEYYLTSGLFYSGRPSWAAKPSNIHHYGKQVFFDVQNT